VQRQGFDLLYTRATLVRPHPVIEIAPGST
jgi:hypothetical protein